MPQFHPKYDVISKKNVFTVILAVFRSNLGDLQKKGPPEAHGPPKVHGPWGPCPPRPPSRDPAVNQNAE